MVIVCPYPLRNLVPFGLIPLSLDTDGSNVRSESDLFDIGVGVGQSQGQPQGQGQRQTAAMQQVVDNFGQQELAFIQQLQDPNSAFVKYVVEQIPSLLTLPLQQRSRVCGKDRCAYHSYLSHPCSRE